VAPWIEGPAGLVQVMGVAGPDAGQPIDDLAWSWTAHHLHHPWGTRPSVTSMLVGGRPPWSGRPDNQPRFTEAEAELRRLLDEADEVLRVKYSNYDHRTELSGGSRPAAYRLALSPPEMT
jgi:hypothetical protein